MLKSTLVTEPSLESKDRENPRLKPLGALIFKGDLFTVGGFFVIGMTFGSISVRAGLAASAFPFGFDC
jgi:hypothetical protein